MATLNEVSSLLQLGAGIGIGLSVFRAPLDIRASNLSRKIERERAALTGINTSVANRKLKVLSSIELTFIERRDHLERFQTPFMAATVFVAFCNLAGLIWASFDASHQLTAWEVAALLFFSVFYYVLAAAFLEFSAQLALGEVQSQLSDL